MFFTASSSDPRVFGPPTWRALHYMARHYPEEPRGTTRRACVRFLGALPFMLPCARCGAHLRRFLRRRAGELEAAAASRGGLEAFLVRAHDAVRRRLAEAAGAPFVPFRSADAAWVYGAEALPEAAPPPLMDGRPLRR